MSSWLSRATGIKPYTLTRIFRTIGIIFFYRLTTFIVIPGINYDILRDVYAKNSSSFFMFNAISGGALSRMSIMTLNIMPYINATIIMQLLVAISPALKELKRDPMQRRIINNYSRFLSLFISIVHSIGICFVLESIPNVVISPGITFKIMTVLYISTASLITLWLAERISSAGIGNGISMITFFNIIASSSLPVINFIVNIFTGKAWSTPMYTTCILILIAIAIIYTFIFEVAVYNIKVFFKKSHEKRISLVDMPMKLNPVGILPAMFAESLSGPIVLFFNNFIAPQIYKLYELMKSTIIQTSPSFCDKLHKFTVELLPNYIKQYDRYTSILFSDAAYAVTNLILKSCFLVFFAFFCIGFAMDPEDIGYNLRSRGICVSGVREGNHTTGYILRVLNAISFFGASCLVVVCSIVPFLLSKLGITISGTSMVIIISVAIELAHKFGSILL